MFLLAAAKSTRAAVSSMEVLVIQIADILARYLTVKKT